MITLIVPLMLLGVLALPVLAISGLMYVLGSASRAAGQTFLWSGITFVVCAILVLVLAAVTFQ